MAAMPFSCNGILLIQGNLPRDIYVVFQMYRNIMLVFLPPISIFYNKHFYTFKTLPFPAMISLLVSFCFQVCSI